MESVKMVNTKMHSAFRLECNTLRFWFYANEYNAKKDCDKFRRLP